jgi:ABC-type nitrate/sulfonate/bicarbonate transport system substrate-binding protein
MVKKVVIKSIHETLEPEKTKIRLLYLRLTDSAPFIVAQEMGFFRRFGLRVELQRETSWATLRDKLIGGAADAAAMLAPMPLTLKQTLPQCSEQMLSGLILSCNGNAITLAENLLQKLPLTEKNCGAEAIGRALQQYLRARTATEKPLTFATVYPFSSHTLQLRHWLGAAGIDADRDIQLRVLPPEQMVDHLQRGEIDGYCVGEPWNTLAVQRGIGVIAAACNQLLPAMPEKVLAVTGSWHAANPATHLALRASLLLACSWLADRAQRADTAALLACENYLQLPVELLSPSLADQLHFRSDCAVQNNPDWHLFAHTGSEHGRPSEEKAQVLLNLCAEFSPVSEAAARAFRSDLYQQTLDFLQHRS